MYIELGKVVGVWGVKGWIKLHSYTRHRADIGNYPSWWLQKKSEAAPVNFQVLNCREQGAGIVAQLEGICDRDQAMALNGHKIMIDESDLPELPEGEYYWQQLIGLRACNLQDEPMGTIESIMETGANDVLVLKRQSGEQEQEILIPYTDQVVRSIDLEQGTMTVDWDLGYLD